MLHLDLFLLQLQVIVVLLVELAAGLAVESISFVGQELLEPLLGILRKRCIFHDRHYWIDSD